MMKQVVMGAGVLVVGLMAAGELRLRTAAAEGGAAKGPVVVKTAEFVRPARAPLGINLEGVADFSRSMMFVDLVKSARKFGTAEAPWDEKAAVDKDGWPTGDSGMVAAAGTPLPAGDYLFSCTGRCELSTVASPASVKLQAYDRDKNLSTAVVTVEPNADKLFLAFKRTYGGIRNIRLLRPGYKADTKEVFNKDFLDAIAPFSTLRLMDFVRTNETDAKEWADRAKPTDALQSSKRGVAWEYGIMLANQTGKDLWINIPVSASDDYVKQLALLLKKTLNKDRVVYVEYSNEVWNGIFPQNHVNYEAAKAEVAAGNTVLNDGGKDTNTYYWGWKRVGERIVEISNLFKSVYAAGGDAHAINRTIRPVLASQSAAPAMARMQLEVIAKNDGPPSKFLYGVAGAPYIGPAAAVGDKDKSTADELLDSANDSGMKWSTGAMFQYLEIARYYRLHPLCYEGGPGFDGEHSVAGKVAANRDPRMEKLIEDYLEAWYGTGGELFMYFNLASPYGKYGCWGLREDIRKPTVKTKAIAQVLAAPLPAQRAETLGTSMPGTLEAWQFMAHSGGGVENSGKAGKDLAYIKDGNWFEYLINVTVAGDYNFTLQTASGGAPGAVEVLFSGDSLGTIAGRKTGDWQTFADTDPVWVRLEKGQLTIRLRIVKGGMNIKSLKLEKR